jgi:hypothetical protein
MNKSASQWVAFIVLSALVLLFFLWVNIRFNMLPPPADKWGKNLERNVVNWWYHVDK